MQKLSLPGTICVAALLCFGSALLAQNQTLLENDQVRVLKAIDKAHVKNAPHEHKLNRVMIYLSNATQEVTPQGGKTTVSHLKTGDVKFSPASGMHVSEVTSDEPLTIIEVELKKQGDPAKSVRSPLDPLKVAPKSYHLLFENDQVRVIRVKMGPHQGVPEHEHALNRVVVNLSDQNTRITASDGTAQTVQHKTGDVSWGTPVKHKEENLQDISFEAIVVELKS